MNIQEITSVIECVIIGIVAIPVTIKIVRGLPSNYRRRIHSDISDIQERMYSQQYRMESIDKTLDDIKNHLQMPKKRR